MVDLTNAELLKLELYAMYRLECLDSLVVWVYFQGKFVVVCGTNEASIDGHLTSVSLEYQNADSMIYFGQLGGAINLQNAQTMNLQSGSRLQMEVGEQLCHQLQWTQSKFLQSVRARLHVSLSPQVIGMDKDKAIGLTTAFHNTHQVIASPNKMMASWYIGVCSRGLTSFVRMMMVMMIKMKQGCCMVHKYWKMLSHPSLFPIKLYAQTPT